MLGNECQGGDCCASALVPGGTFSPGKTTDSKLTVSAFRLDKYEVTVGRYHAFAAQAFAWHAAGNPVAGAGAHPNIPGSGWQSDWLFTTANDCGLHPEYNLGGDATHDAYPMNCVSWVSAAAFCIWDGGRLPTEAEWEYAASGGEADTIYPWGNTPVLTGQLDDSAAYAVYDALGDGVANDMKYADMLPVGSRPAGASPFGPQDLIGSMWEMVLDSDHRTADFPAEATDWANVDRSSKRFLQKGGSWASPFALTSASRATESDIGGDYESGWRCARNP
jgi:formylglycine-generating enzyme required for sulfatase activity